MVNPIPIVINGYDTYYIENADEIGTHLLIAIPPHAEKDISDFCGTFVCGHLITQIDYVVENGTRFIKAYFES